MQLKFAAPCEANGYLQDPVSRLLANLRRWTGRNLVDPGLPLTEPARQLFASPFVVLSYGISSMTTARSMVKQRLLASGNIRIIRMKTRSSWSDTGEFKE